MNIGSWIQTWIAVITNPGEAVFRQERAKPQATLSTAIIWIVVVGIVSGLIGWIALQFVSPTSMMDQIRGTLEQAGLPEETLENIPSTIPFMQPAVSIAGTIGSIIFSIIGFLLFTGLLHLTARIFGGRGSYGTYTYLIASFYIPLSLISSILVLVPFVGICVGPIILIYDIILAHFATRVEHGLSAGKSVFVVLIPVILILGLLGCLIITGMAAFLTIISQQQ